METDPFRVFLNMQLKLPRPKSWSYGYVFYVLKKQLGPRVKARG